MFYVSNTFLTYLKLMKCLTGHFVQEWHLQCNMSAENTNNNTHNRKTDDFLFRSVPSLVIIPILFQSIQLSIDEDDNFVIGK